MRFTDLATYVANERTRSQRLKQLEQMGLIRTASKKTGTRYFVHYYPTRRGKVILKKN